MAMLIISLARRGAAVLGVWGLLTLAGCGSRFHPVPVSGTVTVDGEPLTHFRVSFVPDADKGNTNPVSCTAPMDSQGHYDLRMAAVKVSDDGRGAPVGWYKVVLITGIWGDPPCDIDPKFLDPNKTPLSIEVVENPEPGRYDLKMTRNKNFQPRQRRASKHAPPPPGGDAKKDDAK
jgi:hypothetical protein